MYGIGAIPDGSPFSDPEQKNKPRGDGGDEQGPCSRPEPKVAAYCTEIDSVEKEQKRRHGRPGREGRKRKIKCLGQPERKNDDERCEKGRHAIHGGDI